MFIRLNGVWEACRHFGNLLCPGVGAATTELLPAPGRGRVLLPAGSVASGAQKEVTTSLTQAKTGLECDP